MAQYSRSRAPVSIVQGSQKIFVNELTVLPQVLAALAMEGFSPPRADAAHHITEVVADLRNRFATHFAKSCPNLRDGIVLSKCIVSGPLRKQLVQLNAAHSLLKHYTNEYGDKLVRQVADALAGRPREAADPIDAAGCFDLGTPPDTDIEKLFEGADWLSADSLVVDLGNATANSVNTIANVTANMEDTISSAGISADNLPGGPSESNRAPAARPDAVSDLDGVAQPYFVAAELEVKSATLANIANTIDNMTVHIADTIPSICASKGSLDTDGVSVPDNNAMTTSEIRVQVRQHFLLQFTTLSADIRRKFRDLADTKVGELHDPRAKQPARRMLAAAEAEQLRDLQCRLDVDGARLLAQMCEFQPQPTGQSTKPVRFKLKARSQRK